jgi:hypothetical protein
LPSPPDHDVITMSWKLIPPQCGWGFLPLPSRITGRARQAPRRQPRVQRGERRLTVKLGAMPPPWQRRIRRRRMRAFWEQMEFKARR